MKWLFYIAKRYSIPVIEPLFVEAEKRGVDVAFYVSDKVRRWLPDAWKKETVFTDLSGAVAFNPGFVLCPGNFVDFRLPGLKVALFHGMGVEKPSHYQIRHFFDVYLTSGPVVTRRFEAMRRKYGYFAVHETGWAKVDHILNYPSEGVRKRLNLPQGIRVVLYAPTHSRRMQSAEALLPSLDSLMNDDEIWICKPHELMNRELLADLAAQRSDRFRLIDDYDITPWLHAADVMVSDTSSVLYEFMLLDKPVVTYRTLDRRDKGIDIDSPDALRPALNRCFEKPGEFSARRKKHLAEVNPRCDGSVAATIYSILADMDPSQPAGTRRKPMNLFRKAQILYHSRWRRGYLR